MQTRILFFLFFSILYLQTFSQKSIEPLFISEKIQIDGYFEEEAWQTAAIATGFVQTQPEPNSPASQKTEVRIAYDDQAVYVAAKLFVTQGSPIYKELGQRDNLGVNAESFFVFFDTFNDDQNGFSFGVTAAGVQADAKYSNSGEDFQWDGVWESKTRISEEGWYVEMKIPNFNLRFAEKDVQNWGFNILRNIRENREQNFWNFVDQNVNGFVNQWGELANIQGLEPPLRLSFTPFISTNLGKVTGGSLQSDFNAGMDLKYGLNDSFTLDMTLIPDFGGVRSDEQILNLGPFEQRFDENRAFFTEGTELFGKNRLFYSRRIGQTPSGYSDVYNNLGENEKVSENPTRTNLLNATKVSGRTKNNFGLGFFNAVTNRAEARIIDTLTGQSRMVETEALTNYNILVAEKALKNASSVYIINTNVNRTGSARDANVTGIGAEIRDKKNKYAVETSGSFSQIFTKDEYGLTRNQTGFTAGLEAYETEGNLNYGLGTNIESDTYNPNDFGILFANNEANQFLFASYNQNEQTDWYRSYRLNANVQRRSLYKPSVETGYNFNFRGNIWLNNLSAIWGGVFHSPGTKDYFEPRTGDFETYLQRPKRTFAEVGFSTDYNKKFAIDANIERGSGNDHIPIDVVNFFVQPRYRFSDKFITSVEYSNSQQNKNVGFAGYATGSDNLTESILGYRDRTRNQTELNAEYKFNDLMNLSVFGRYTWDKVEYESFHTLENNGKLTGEFQFEDLTETPDDVNFSGFNLDAIFNWRFAPGSDIIVVYKKQISEFTTDLRTDYFRNFEYLADQDQSDVLNLKVVYFIDYNSLKKKEG